MQHDDIFNFDMQSLSRLPFAEQAQGMNGSMGGVNGIADSSRQPGRQAGSQASCQLNNHIPQLRAPFSPPSFLLHLSIFQAAHLKYAKKMPLAMQLNSKFHPSLLLLLLLLVQ